MVTEPDVLVLRIDCPPPGGGTVQVRPIVSGRDLLSDVYPGGVGTSPRYLLDVDMALRATTPPREIRLAGGGCGYEPCCGALYTTIRRDGEHVVWADWRDPADGDIDLPEIRFDGVQYEAEIRRAAQDRGWEWPAGAVARLLETRLRAREDWLARWECELQGVWASREEPDRIHVVLWHPHIAEDRPYVQFGITLPVSADDPAGPAEQAERHEERLTAGDPRETADVWGGSADCAEKLGYPWPARDGAENEGSPGGLGGESNET